MTTFNLLTGTNNPFEGFDVGFYSAPTFGDIDGDGDLDAIVGEKPGTLNYFQNTGDAITPSFIQKIGTANPFSSVDVGAYSIPIFADLDGDGDLDAIIGEKLGNLNYFLNTGNANNPNFTQQAGTNNPFNGFDVGFESAPTLTDLDGDGDLDAIVGENNGTLNYFQNIGDATNPRFLKQVGTNNPFNGIDVGFESVPTFTDLDEDGDLDAIVGENNGTLNYFQNMGDAINPLFSQQMGTDNPFNGVDVGDRSTPIFVEFEGDGDLDVISGNENGTLFSLANERPLKNPSFLEQFGTNNPFNGLNFGDSSIPIFADIDGDKDLDIFTGNNDGFIQYFENIGDAINPSYIEQIGLSNPLNGFDVGQFADPTFADIDGDGDLDAIVGNSDGTLAYFENRGDVTIPNFTEQTGTLNPFSGFDVGGFLGGFASPTFVDIDGDGDLDAFIGELGYNSGDLDGRINYFENTGDVTTPSFMEQTGTLNPFNGFIIGNSADPIFADLDGDGDLDAFSLSSGYNVGRIQYLENIGDAMNPSFTRLGGMNPFNGFDVGFASTPAFGDIDGDGDLDALLGRGTPKYFENLGVARETDAIISNDRLSITDVNGGTSIDSITLTETGGFLRVEDPNQTIRATSGISQVDINTVEVPLSSIGQVIKVRTFSGADSITANTTLSLNLSAGLGNDTVIGGSSRDTLIGSVGNDSIDGDDGNDFIMGGTGDDTLKGGKGADRIEGQEDNDLILGLDNNDSIDAGGGNDIVNAGRGNDNVSGSSGRDLLNGSIGDDILMGGSDQDILIGSRGNDQLNGEGGLDILNGADNVNFGVNERDTLIGGRGTQDRFKLGETTGAYYLDSGPGGVSNARILDFERLDRIILHGSSSDYRIVMNGGDSFIVRKEPGVDDTVGIVENTVGLNLASIQFIYI